MRTKQNFKLRPLGKDFILTAEGDSQINFNKMISFNQSAAFLWKAVEGKEFSAQILAELLIGEYGIDADLAAKDSASIIKKWIDAGIAEE